MQTNNYLSNYGNNSTQASKGNYGYLNNGLLKNVNNSFVIPEKWNDMVTML